MMKGHTIQEKFVTVKIIKYEFEVNYRSFLKNPDAKCVNK